MTLYIICNKKAKDLERGKGGGVKTSKTVPINFFGICLESLVLNFLWIGSIKLHRATKTN